MMRQKIGGSAGPPPLGPQRQTRQQTASQIIAGEQAYREMSRTGPPPAVQSAMDRHANHMADAMLMGMSTIKTQAGNDGKIHVKKVDIRKDLSFYEELQAGVDTWLKGVLPQPVSI
jgi:hypothetical protein